MKNLKEKSPPNIILINCDDLGFGDLGCYGSTRNDSPHIDRLAREGTRMTDAELIRLGLIDNTLVIFTSDNGSRARDGGGSNAPLRRIKGTTWEGRQRPPLHDRALRPARHAHHGGMNG